MSCDIYSRNRNDFSFSRVEMASIIMIHVPIIGSFIREELIIQVGLILLMTLALVSETNSSIPSSR